MAKIDGIIVHCSDTPAFMDIGVAEIRHWHVYDNGWRDIGYHYIIRRDGTAEQGRPLDEDEFITGDEVGAHTLGFNKTKIGICLIGGQDGFNFTSKQMATLLTILDFMIGSYSLLKASVIGHNQVSDKACPQFDVSAFYTSP